MTPEDKKLAAEWMGWSLEMPPTEFVGINFCDWNPDAPDCPNSVWQEIWKRMIDLGHDGHEKTYIDRYEELLNKWGFGNWISGHVILPEIRTKAWVEVINTPHQEPKEEDKEERR